MNLNPIEIVEFRERFAEAIREVQVLRKWKRKTLSTLQIPLTF
jgi:hypothetical protein